MWDGDASTDELIGLLGQLPRFVARVGSVAHGVVLLDAASH